MPRVVDGRAPNPTAELGDPPQNYALSAIARRSRTNGSASAKTSSDAGNAQFTAKPRRHLSRIGKMR